jgi:L-ascorbate metabolism protein UlaG (beta-lactamase superfamily)
MIQRRTFLTSAAAAGAATTLLRPFAAMAQNLTGDIYKTDAGDTVSVHPVQHASFVMVTPAGAIYVDPVGGAEAYAALPPADFILITHHHGDHFDPETLAGLVTRAGAPVPMITNPTVGEQLPQEMQATNTVMANGDSGTLMDMPIEAIPAYNMTPERLEYHPQGRDNGYILEVGGLRICIAGDTENTPEMKALSDIDIAFVPFNLPYTMTEEQAADGVAAFAPKVVYPYHYRDSDPQKFASLLAESGAETEVVMGPWYAS